MASNDMAATRKKLISIIVPVFNEVENIDPLLARLDPVSDSLAAGYDFEYVFIDDGSSDGSFELLAKRATQNRRIRVLSFSRNFGFQRSIITGLMECRGDAAIQIDADLQDPPELFSDFIEQWESGNDVVYGVRRGRKEGKIENFSRRTFYRVINTLSEDHLPLDAGDFRLVSRRVIDALEEVDDYHPYLRGTIASFGFNQAGVAYDRAARERGESKLRWRKMISLGVDGILHHSVLPLRIAMWVGALMTVLMFGGIVWYVVGSINDDLPPGLATTVVLIMASIILNAVFMGILGAYIGRIYQQVKRRPFTIVADRVGYGDDQSPSRQAAPYRDRDVDESAQPGRDSGPEPPDGSIDSPD